MKEIIIAWKKQYWNRVRNPEYGSEWSLDNGIFGHAMATLTYRTQEPAVLCYSDPIPLKDVRIATEVQRDLYLTTHAKIEDLRTQLKQIEKDIVENGVPITWEWILAHGKQREPNGETGEVYVPVPFKSKKELVNLRKGSHVVLSTVSSAYSGFQTQVGKIVKKRSKDVIVQFKRGTYRIPYCDLKPAHEVSMKQRRENERNAQMLGRVAANFNKIAGEALK